MHRTVLIPSYMMNHEQASMKLHCQIHSSLSQTSLTGFNYDLTRLLVTFTCFMSHSWPIHETRDRQKKNFWENHFLKPNWYPVRIIEKSHSMLKLTCCLFGLYFQPQKCCWPNSSLVEPAQAVYLLCPLEFWKLEESVIWTIAERNLTYKPSY